MSDAVSYRPDLDDDVWCPPLTFRDGLADTERLAQVLVDEVTGEGALLVPAERLEFLARRLHRLARDSHLALPPEVT